MNSSNKIIDYLNQQATEISLGSTGSPSDTNEITIDIRESFKLRRTLGQMVYLRLIEDVDFLQQLSAGTVRLHTDDVLQVRLRTVQKIDRNNDIYTHHYIEKVLDYRKAEHLRQSDMFNDVDIKGGEEVS